MGYIYIDPNQALPEHIPTFLSLNSSFFMFFFVQGGDGGPHSLGLRHWKFSPDEALCTARVPPRDSATRFGWWTFQVAKI